VIAHRSAEFLSRKILMNPTASNPAPIKQFAGLEIARFLCALAVMFWHYQHFFITGIAVGKEVQADEVTKFPFYRIFSFFYDNGHFAVPIFWMISGFIFFWKYSEALNNGRVTAYRFFVLRFSRLYPLHFLTLIIVTLLQIIYIRTHGTGFVYSDTDPFHFVLQVLFASNWLDQLPFTFNGPIWSVSIEVIVYAFFLVVVTFLRPGLALCVLFAVAAKGVSHFYPERVLECVEYFFVGGLIRSVAGALSHRHRLVALAVSAVGLCLSIATHFKFGSIIGFSFFVVSTFALLDEAVSLRRSRVVKVGDLTYASYLLHFPVQLAVVLVIDALGVSRNLFLEPVALVAFILGTFGLSWLVFKGFEMPAQAALRAAWLRSGERAVTTAA
jgi:peptidoglycan/LPS O-acetylase OafA/YrhL